MDNMGSDAPASARSADKSASAFRFVARQPILTAEQKIFGYELLFRDGAENYFREADVEGAARSTLDSSLLLGLDVLCGGGYAFINCTRDVLLRGYATLLPPEQTVIEVLETVTPDEEVIAACHRLRQAGYLVALDDFVPDDPRAAMADVVDLIKVDIHQTSTQQAGTIVKQFGKQHRMLAEKVETRLEFQVMRNLGFIHFQGFFFRVPEVVSAHDIPANKLNYLRMLQAVARDEMDLREIENLIKGEVSLCYRLLRYLNSALFAFRSEIRSVRHALSMLGEREIRRWVQLVATIAAGEQKCSEVVLTALTRARFCELLAPKVPHGNCDLFLMGLMSLMDAVLEMPMSTVLEKVRIVEPIKDVILGHPSPLRSIYRLMLAQESGEWAAVADLSKQLRLGGNEVADAYFRALQWAREVSGGD